MKIKTKLSLALAVMTIGAQIGSVALAATQAEHARAIETAMASGNLAAVADYVAANPEVTEGDSPLAVALQSFVAGYALGSYSISPQLSAALAAAAATSSEASAPNSIY